MNLYDFAIETKKELDNANSVEYSTLFVNKKIECFNKYHNGLITSNSHGLEFFDNIIKYWNKPDSYYTKKDISSKNVDYEYNFILILKNNK